MIRSRMRRLRICSVVWGNFGLAIVARGANVIGVEGAKRWLRAAENAARNGLSSRARFFAADLYTDLDAAMKKSRA